MVKEYAEEILEYGAETERKKVIAVSVDGSIVDRLNELKKSKRMKTLSPVINKLILDWLDKIEKDNNK